MIAPNEATSPFVPVLKPAGRIEVKVAPPMMLGELAGTERRLISILGGSVEVAGRVGQILPGGSDLQEVRADGTISLTARYAADFGDAGKLLIENTGLRREKRAGDDSRPEGGTPDGGPYFRGVLHFSAPPGALHWLNDSIFVSSGVREGGTVYLDIHQVC
ncbi:DUF3237 family protein [Noviherbaspirillum galbum]|uniref:DUF3237 family protein n=1 Tax=Noviherbaspirillum galbum TaxID=2709383 RepID=A0A6B3STQ6_9BURK|nr:DUF3237 family protein [Noviherbaspirillum galbum]NEX62246.1 DUF3237 family protein [Noviherbaspirillum galbum]